MKELYLVSMNINTQDMTFQNIVYEIPYKYPIGLTTKKKFTSINYKIKILQWLLKQNYHHGLVQIKAIKINDLEFVITDYAKDAGITVIDDITDRAQLKYKIKKLQIEMLPSYVACKTANKSIARQRRIPEDIEKKINNYLKFGKRKKKTAGKSKKK
jgi:hypothetical protein